MYLRLFLLINMLLCCAVTYAEGWTDMKANIAVNNETINSVITDSYGNVYIKASKGTQTGIWQYNKRTSQWESVDLPDTVHLNSQNTFLFSDSCGSLDVYYGNTQDVWDLWKYAPTNNTWEKAQGSQKPTNIDLPHASATDHSGNLYLYNTRSRNPTYFKYSCTTNTWQNTHQLASIVGLPRNVATDNFGNFYASFISGAGTSVWKYDSLYYNKTTGQFGKWLDTNFPTPPPKSDIITLTMTADGFGNLYTASMLYDSNSESGSINLWQYQAATNHWSEIKKDIIGGLPDNSTAISFITADAAGNVYVVASAGAGTTFSENAIGKYTASNDLWEPLPQKFPIGSSFSSIMLDRSGGIYVTVTATENSYPELFKYYPKTTEWKNTMTQSGLHIKAENIARDKLGNFYAVTTNADGVTDVWKYTPAHPEP